MHTLVKFEGRVKKGISNKGIVNQSASKTLIKPYAQRHDQDAVHVKRLICELFLLT